MKKQTNVFELMRQIKELNEEDFYILSDWLQDYRFKKIDKDFNENINKLGRLL